MEGSSQNCDRSSPILPDIPSRFNYGKSSYEKTVRPLRKWGGSQNSDRLTPKLPELNIV